MLQHSARRVAWLGATSQAAAVPSISAQQNAAFSSAGSSAPNSAPPEQVAWVFLGPPGVGKGTYASRIAKALNVPHIAAGDLVRAEIKSGSALGEQVCNPKAHGDCIPCASHAMRHASWPPAQHAWTPCLACIVLHALPKGPAHTPPPPPSTHDTHSRHWSTDEGGGEPRAAAAG